MNCSILWWCMCIVVSIAVEFDSSGSYLAIAGSDIRWYFPPCSCNINEMQLFLDVHIGTRNYFFRRLLFRIRSSSLDLSLWHSSWKLIQFPSTSFLHLTNVSEGASVIVMLLVGSIKLPMWRWNGILSRHSQIYQAQVGKLLSAFRQNA